MNNIDPWQSYDERFREKLIGAFLTAFRFMKDKCENSGWYPTSNYLREHVRAATGLRFSNTVSPTVLRIIKERYPEYRGWIDTQLLKSERNAQSELFPSEPGA